MKEDFHTFAARGLFAAKHGRPDTGMSLSVLTTRVRAPSVDDWGKFVRYMQYVKHTQDEVLTLSADNLHIIKWFVDASFAAHPDFRSHTGAVVTYRECAIQLLLTKQKLDTRSSCESKLVGVDDSATKILWAKLFICLLYTSPSPRD